MVWIPSAQLDYPRLRGGVNAAVGLKNGETLITGGMHSNAGENMPKFKSDCVRMASQFADFSSPVSNQEEAEKAIAGESEFTIQSSHCDKLPTDCSSDKEVVWKKVIITEEESSVEPQPKENTEQDGDKFCNFGLDGDLDSDDSDDSASHEFHGCGENASEDLVGAAWVPGSLGAHALLCELD